MQDLEDGKIDFNIFIGPTTRRWAGIGKNTEEGQWNDIREDLEWNVDRDQSQAGQARSYRVSRPCCPPGQGNDARVSQSYAHPGTHRISVRS